jgi:hypothetical protein
MPALPTRALSTLLLAATLVGTTGCMEWSPAVTPRPAPTTSAAAVAVAKPRHVLVWAGSARYELTDAAWRGDTLVGRRAEERDELRLARSAVDSVRVRRLRPGATFAAAAGVVGGIGATAFLAVLAAFAGGCCD